MSLTSSVLAAVSVLSMWTAGSSPSPQPDTLRVHVNIQFDASIKSTVIKAVAKKEVAAIWSIYGVELIWSDEACDAALDLEVVIAGREPGTVLDGSLSVLGTATVDREGLVQGPIHISLETIEWLLQHRTDIVPVLHDRELGRALGRVLAHEIGHVLLGVPTYHDSKGLMRAQMPLPELLRFDRKGLQLTEASVRRLHDHMARAAEAQGSRGDSGK
jgi:hypothetical protein